MYPVIGCPTKIFPESLAVPTKKPVSKIDKTICGQRHGNNCLQILLSSSSELGCQIYVLILQAIKTPVSGCRRYIIFCKAFLNTNVFPRWPENKRNPLMTSEFFKDWN